MGKLIFLLKQFTLLFLRKFFLFLTGGQDCVICSSQGNFYPVCAECEKKYFSINETFEKDRICRICGKTLISEKDFCMDCRNAPLLKSLDGVFPLFSYRLWNMQLLIRWKINGERLLSPFFAGLIYKKLCQLKKEFGEFPVVAVPPRPGKIRNEGWDQIEELCQFLQYKYDFKILRIFRRISSIQQKSLDRKGRLLTIGQSYCLKKEGIKLPEIVCILDDVMTTGSTLESLASILKKNGVKTVLAVTLFTVDS